MMASYPSVTLLRNKKKKKTFSYLSSFPCYNRQNPSFHFSNTFSFIEPSAITSAPPPFGSILLLRLIIFSFRVSAVTLSLHSRPSLLSPLLAIFTLISVINFVAAARMWICVLEVNEQTWLRKASQTVQLNINHVNAKSRDSTDRTDFSLFLFFMLL